MKRLALRIVGSALFNTDLVGDMGVTGRALETGRARFLRRMWEVIRLPVGIPTRRNRIFLRAVREAEAVIYRIIAEHRRRPDANGDDLLSTLMRARDEETGEGMSDRSCATSL